MNQQHNFILPNHINGNYHPTQQQQIQFAQFNPNPTQLLPIHNNLNPTITNNHPTQHSEENSLYPYEDENVKKMNVTINHYNHSKSTEMVKLDDPSMIVIHNHTMGGSGVNNINNIEPNEIYQSNPKKRPLVHHYNKNQIIHNTPDDFIQTNMNQMTEINPQPSPPQQCNNTMNDNNDTYHNVTQPYIHQQHNVPNHQAEQNVIHLWQNDESYGLFCRDDFSSYKRF